MPDSPPILSFDLPNGRGKRSFETIDEFEKWLGKENVWWNKLGGGLQGQNNEIYNQWRHFFGGVSENIRIIKAPGAAGQIQKNQAESAVRIALNQNYSQKQLPESDSPEGLIISDYLQKDPNLAYGFLATITAPNISLQNKPIAMWSGFLLGSLHRVGMLKEAKVDQDYLTSVEKDWRERLERLRLDMAETNDSSRNFLEEIREDHKRQLEENKTQQELQKTEKERQAKEFFDLGAKLKKDFEDLRDRYNRELAFRAPATYWTAKAKVHRKAAIVWGLVWLLVGGASVVGILLVIRPFLAPESKIDYQHGALLLLLSGFAIWLMRILTRMFLSSVHQHSDAAQRKTMVETYLALEAEGKLTGEQRTMIIEAMFRPVTMGVVKEDETPSHPFGLISKIVAKD
jgi:Family of unknown function (DUF6161)